MLNVRRDMRHLLLAGNPEPLRDDGLRRRSIGDVPYVKPCPGPGAGLRSPAGGCMSTSFEDTTTLRAGRPNFVAPVSIASVAVPDTVQRRA